MIVRVDIPIVRRVVNVVIDVRRIVLKTGDEG